MFEQSANQADTIGLPSQGAGLYRQAKPLLVNDIYAAYFSAQIEK